MRGTGTKCYLHLVIWNSVKCVALRSIDTMKNKTGALFFQIFYGDVVPDPTRRNCLQDEMWNSEVLDHHQQQQLMQPRSSLYDNDNKHSFLIHINVYRSTYTKKNITFRNRLQLSEDKNTDFNWFHEPTAFLGSWNFKNTIERFDNKSSLECMIKLYPNVRSSPYTS